MNNLDKKNTILVPAEKQSTMKLFQVEKQIEKDGVEMGVLENGIPFLSESGLARMCGIDRKVLNRLAINWREERAKPRGIKINLILQKSGFNENQLYLKSTFNKREINAYTEPVCLAVLEYYAFEAEEKKEQAQNAFRTLARIKFREYIYDTVGYAPNKKILDLWRNFHDRVSLTNNATPFGFFCVFNEIASMIIPMIRSGLIISDKTVPDISVGKIWSTYWKENDLDVKYGERVKYKHNYPEYYPQAKSNPQNTWAYPDDALGEFRRWLTENYILTKYPKYLLNQAKQGKLDCCTYEKALDVFSH